jgi:hypothetical protein
VSGGLTVSEIVGRTGLKRGVLQRLLDEERERGNVVYEGGRWRLDDVFAAEFGHALNLLPVLRR